MAGGSRVHSAQRLFTDWFQSSPGVRAGGDEGGGALWSNGGLVSILTRRESRGRRGQEIALHERIMFQSSPGVRAGCDQAYAGISIPPGVVSILTRRESRVRLGFLVHLLRDLEFQSSPGVRAGCDRSLCRPSASLHQFQSSLGVRAGCDALILRARHPDSGFNPHPA